MKGNLAEKEIERYERGLREARNAELKRRLLVPRTEDELLKELLEMGGFFADGLWEERRGCGNFY